MVAAMRGCSSYLAMVIVQLSYAGSNVLVKMALDKGLNQLVFIIYRHIVSTLILFPFAYVLERKERPSLCFPLMAKIFLVASFGTTIYLNVYYAGLRCTSPTVAGALSNLIPSLTLVAAVLLGMESVKLRSGRGRAKAVGTVISIGGSLSFTLWKGKRVWNGWAARGALVHVSEEEKWVEGAVLIVVSCVCWSTWLILQASICSIYPAPLSLSFFINLFAVLQCSLAAAILWFWGRNPTLWESGWDVQLFAILYCVTHFSIIYLLLLPPNPHPIFFF